MAKSGRQKAAGTGRDVAGLFYPTPAKITGRSSTIRAQFIKAIIPEICPTEEQLTEALLVLEQSRNQLICSYCGTTASEWDHFHSVVDDKQATGYVTDVYNLVPACGKCNQSKGSKPWRQWMHGNARLAPRNRKDFDADKFARRVAILQRFEEWGEGKIYQIAKKTLDSPLFKDYFERCEALIASFSPYQKEAERLKEKIARAATADSAHEPS